MRTLFAIVVHTLVFERGRLLLLRRANTGFLDGWYTPPGGHRQAGEGVAQAAIRECREEARIEVERIRPVAALPYDGGVDFVFEAMRWSGRAEIGEPARCDRLVFAPLDALPEPTAPFVADAVDSRASGRWFRED